MFIIHKSSFVMQSIQVIDTGKSLIGNDFTDTNHCGEIIERLSLKTGIAKLH